MDRFGAGLLLASTGVVGTAVVGAASGLSLPGSLLILALAPTVTVVGYERLGYRHQAAALAHNAPIPPLIH